MGKTLAEMLNSVEEGESTSTIINYLQEKCPGLVEEVLERGVNPSFFAGMAAVLYLIHKHGPPCDLDNVLEYQ